MTGRSPTNAAEIIARKKVERPAGSDHQLGLWAAGACYRLINQQLPVGSSSPGGETLVSGLPARPLPNDVPCQPKPQSHRRGFEGRSRLRRPCRLVSLPVKLHVGCVTGARLQKRLKMHFKAASKLFVGLQRTQSPTVAGKSSLDRQAPTDFAKCSTGCPIAGESFLIARVRLDCGQEQP